MQSSSKPTQSASQDDATAPQPAERPSAEAADVPGKAEAKAARAQKRAEAAEMRRQAAELELLLLDEGGIGPAPAAGENQSSDCRGDVPSINAEPGKTETEALLVNTLTDLQACRAGAHRQKCIYMCMVKPYAAGRPSRPQT